VFCCIAILHQILLFKSPFGEKCCWEQTCLAALCPCQVSACTAAVVFV